MKNILFVIMLVGMSIPILSQESEDLLTNKNGVIILPEQGDIAIGIDAVPFLNMLNNKGGSPGFNFVNNIPALTVKYFLSDRSALKINLRINFSLTKDGTQNFTSFMQETNHNYGLTFGYERRLGKTRVQGFYGVEGGASFGKDKITDNDTIVLKEILSFGFGLDGFIGVEYYIAPKLSIGGQFSWGPDYLFERDLENHTQSSSLIITTRNLHGALILSFAF